MGHRAMGRGCAEIDRAAVPLSEPPGGTMNNRSLPGILKAGCIAFAAMNMLSFAQAATFDVDLQRDSCELRLTGAIEPGDLEKLKAKLPADFDPVMKGGPTICLNSPGGDFLEGLRIADYISNGISTKIEKDAVCMSACGWIFLAGTSAATGGVRDWTRTMDAHAQLVFHAPYIDPATLTPGPAAAQPMGLVQVINAYNQAVGEIAQGLLKLAQKYDSPPKSPLVPPTLLAEAMVRVGKQLLVVDSVGAVVRWRIAVDGYASVVPTSRQDIVRACLLASWQANEWPPDFLSTPSADFISNKASPDHEEYVGYYDPTEHRLTAQVVIYGRGNIACELQFQFNDQLNGLTDPITGTANLGPNDSLARGQLSGNRAPTQVTLPDFSVLPQETLLKDLPAREGRSVNMNSLVTQGVPDWCRAQEVKKPEEKAICQSAKLSAYDVTLNRFYRAALAGDSKVAAQTDQKSWLPRRQLCGDDTDCLEQTYRAQIARLRGYLP
jgi:hypothetical protein